MSLANLLSEEGHPPEDLQTTAHVVLEQLDTGFTITRIELTTKGRVAGRRRGGVRAPRRAGEGDLPGLARARRDARSRSTRSWLGGE